MQTENCQYRNPTLWGIAVSDVSLSLLFLHAHPREKSDAILLSEIPSPLSARKIRQSTAISLPRKFFNRKYLLRKIHRFGSVQH